MRITVDESVHWYCSQYYCYCLSANGNSYCWLVWSRLIHWMKECRRLGERFKLFYDNEAANQQFFFINDKNEPVYDVELTSWHDILSLVYVLRTFWKFQFLSVPSVNVVCGKVMVLVVPFTLHTWEPPPHRSTCSNVFTPSPHYMGTYPQGDRPRPSHLRHPPANCWWAGGWPSTLRLMGLLIEICFNLFGTCNSCLLNNKYWILCTL